MPVSPPRRAVFMIALALALTGLLAALGIVRPLEAYAFWMVFVAWLLLAIGCATEHL